MELSIKNPVTWIVYCAIYVVSFAGLTGFLWLNLEAGQPANLIDYLAKVSGGSVGIALFAGLSWEVIRAMVLLAPMLKKRLMEQARQEGREEGRQEGREEGRRELAQQIVEASARSGQSLPADIDRLLDRTIDGESGGAGTDVPPNRHRRSSRRRRRRDN